jgi:hypothetical protein
MKKYIILPVFLVVGIIGIAQDRFTQVAFKEMLGEYKKDSKAFFINRLSEDFRYSNPQGKYLYKSDVAAAGKTAVVKTSDAQKIVTTIQTIETMLENALANDVLEPVIIQSSNLAIVSGIQENSNDGKVACTYTFQKRKGKWMFVASQQTKLAE